MKALTPAQKEVVEKLRVCFKERHKGRWRQTISVATHGVKSVHFSPPRTAKETGDLSINLYGNYVQSYDDKVFNHKLVKAIIHPDGSIENDYNYFQVLLFELDNNIPRKTVSAEEFINTLLDKNKTLYLVDYSNWFVRKDQITCGLFDYAGARMDRLSSRNGSTNKFGFPEVKREGRKFWSVEYVDGGGGTFLADILSHYGKDYYIIADDVRLDLKHDITYQTGIGYGHLKPTI